MDCIQPPALSDAELFALIDGSTDALLQEHIQHCPSCAARLNEIQQFNNALEGRLMRWNCPKPQQLQNYAFGLLTEGEAQGITSHLKTCALCRADTTIYSEIRKSASTPQPSVTQAPVFRPNSRSHAPARRSGRRELIAQIMPPSPAYALRGVSDAGPLLAQVGGITLFLEKIADGKGNANIEGYLDADNLSEWVEAFVELHQNDTLIGTAFVAKSGRFQLESTLGGVLDLKIIAHSGNMIVLKHFELQGKL